MPDRLTLHWHLGLIGFAFVLMLVSIPLFVVAAFVPSLASELAQQRRGAFLAWGQVGGFNGIAGAAAVICTGSAARAGWRWADEAAVRADAHGLSFHRSTARSPLAWSSARALAFVRGRATGVLTVETIAGKAFTIRPVDPVRGAEFVRVATERWLALSPTAPRI